MRVRVCAGILANAGLLLPFELAYEANNWDERLIPISRAWTTFGGQVYGVGHELEAQGLYFNKRIFAELKNWNKAGDLCRDESNCAWDVPRARL